MQASTEVIRIARQLTGREVVLMVRRQVPRPGWRHPGRPGRWPPGSQATSKKSTSKKVGKRNAAILIPIDYLGEAGHNGQTSIGVTVMRHIAVESESGTIEIDGVIPGEPIYLDAENLLRLAIMLMLQLANLHRAADAIEPI